MFTGIIETTGVIEEIREEGSNLSFKIRSTIANELKVDQSVSHDGVCLTVTKVDGDWHWVTAIHETLSKSNLRNRVAGEELNLERCMVANGRFDGHIVQGHVDQPGLCKSVVDQNGSWLFEFSYDTSLNHITVEKGSVCVNGVSLTCFNVKKGQFSVAIIPYTFEHTNFRKIKAGDNVNLEFDIIGKYVRKLLGK